MARTLLFTGNSSAINLTIYRNPGYATGSSRPVAIAALDSQGLAVNAANPARTLEDFVRAAKAQAAKSGSAAHRRIIAEYVLKVMAKTKTTAVPFQRSAGSTLSRQSRGYHRGADRRTYRRCDRALRVLAVSGSKRSAAFPDVPMLREAGFPGLEINGWIGILAPAATPDDICLKINSAVNAAIGKPAVNERLRSLGYEPHAMPLTGTAPFLTNSIETWRKMILATGMAIN
jgi:tripartite-type tricarboxylate transporter receptor subunit TctC